MRTMKTIGRPFSKLLIIPNKNNLVAAQVIASSWTRKHFKVGVRVLTLSAILVMDTVFLGEEARSTEPSSAAANSSSVASNNLLQAPWRIPSEFEINMADMSQEDKTSSENGAVSDEIIVRKLGDHVLYIPKGYLSSFLGYSGYVQIHALLPCLLPETDENAMKFQSMDNILIATLSMWDYLNLTGEHLLGLYMSQSLYAIISHPSLKNESIFAGRIDNTDLYQLKDFFLGTSDIFVRPKPLPLFLFKCDGPDRSPFPAAPNCSVRERIFEDQTKIHDERKMNGDILLEYHYRRSFINQDINNGIKIDEKLRSLLDSFLKAPESNNQKNQGGTCQ